MIISFDAMQICYNCKSKVGNSAQAEVFAKDGKGIKVIKYNCNCGYSWTSKRYEKYKQEANQKSIL